MKCPHCQHELSTVIDSRPNTDGTVKRRRRVCQGCKGRYTTYEAVEGEPGESVGTELVRSHLRRLRDGLERLESQLGSRPAEPTDGGMTEPTPAGLPEIDTEWPAAELAA